MRMCGCETYAVNTQGVQPRLSPCTWNERGGWCQRIMRAISVSMTEPRLGEGTGSDAVAHTEMRDPKRWGTERMRWGIGNQPGFVGRINLSP